ncbi:MAG: hypothetical protein DRP29_04010 [Thermodesulfobacteriota bacterium]|nr:MAG: hypothetical protein DRP29_04010 [Thermodesulfobacteriota bacterium]
MGKSDTLINKNPPLSNFINFKEFAIKVSKKLQVIKAGALARIDIFEMGYINLIYGFEKGNKILEAVGNLLKKHMRYTDIVAKTGGDEFAIFVELPKEENTIAIAEKLRELFIFPIENVTVFINAGISIFPIDGKTFTELFEKAGFALKEAKKEGPNVIKFYTLAFEEKITDLLKTETLIEKAIRKGLFKFYYQPIFDTKTLKISGFEALARIVEEDGNLYPAEKFIYVLEKHHYIDVFEEKLIKEAILKSKKWNLPISINLSERGFLTETFLKKIIKYYQSGCKIIIEIVERTLIKDPKRAIEILTKLKEIGFYIVIDDFGTGYSSLAYLKDLPFDMLKIDISFIKELPYNQKVRRIVEFIVELGKKLKVKICAEGVEKKEQLEFLKNIGCDYVQGFLLGKPRSQKEIENRSFHFNLLNISL